MLKLNTIIRETLMTRKSDSWPTYDGSTLTRSDFITASEANKCLRNLAFTKHDERATAVIEDYWDQMSVEEYNRRLEAFTHINSPQGIFDRGHNIEAWAVRQIRAGLTDDEVFLFAGEYQRSFYDAKDRVSGTPDGVFLDEDGKMWLTEFKSSNTPVAAPKSGHETQVLVNIGLIEHLIKKHGVKKVLGHDNLPDKFAGGTLLYILADDYLNMSEFPVEHDAGALYVKTSQRAKKLFKPDGSLTRPSELPPEGITNNGCFFCKYKQICAAVEEEHRDASNLAKLRNIIDKETGKKPTMPVFKAAADRDKVIKLLIKYDDLSQTEKDAKEQKDAIKASIKEWVAMQEDMKCKFSALGRKISVSLSRSERAGGVDKKKLEAFLESVGAKYSNYVKPSTEVETLRVTVTMQDAV